MKRQHFLYKNLHTWSSEATLPTTIILIPLMLHAKLLKIKKNLASGDVHAAKQYQAPANIICALIYGGIGRAPMASNSLSGTCCVGNTNRR